MIQVRWRHRKSAHRERKSQEPHFLSIVLHLPTTCAEYRNTLRRARSDAYPRLVSRPDRGAAIGPNHTVPTGRISLFERIPGNKLPGYHHLVPPGQTHLRPYVTRMRGFVLGAWPPPKRDQFPPANL